MWKLDQDSKTPARRVAHVFGDSTGKGYICGRFGKGQKFLARLAKERGESQAGAGEEAASQRPSPVVTRHMSPGGLFQNAACPADTGLADIFIGHEFARRMSVQALFTKRSYPGSARASHSA